MIRPPFLPFSILFQRQSKRTFVNLNLLKYKDINYRTHLHYPRSLCLFIEFYAKHQSKLALYRVETELNKQKQCKGALLM